MYVFSSVSLARDKLLFFSIFDSKHRCHQLDKEAHQGRLVGLSRTVCKLAWTTTRYPTRIQEEPTLLCLLILLKNMLSCFDTHNQASPVLLLIIA